MLLIAAPSYSQKSYNQSSILFYELNTAHGLSDNYIHDMCMDKSGNLWIGSGEGLNMFNGKTVTKFFKEEYPQLQSDFISQIVCDDNNRIWIMTLGGYITMIDENRTFHKVRLYNGNTFIATNKILKTESNGIILFTSAHFYSVAAGKNLSAKDSINITDFSPILIDGFTCSNIAQFSNATDIGKDDCIIPTASALIKINFKAKQVVKEYSFSNLTILTQWKPNELLVYDKVTASTFSVNLITGDTAMAFDAVKDQHGLAFTGRCNRALLVNNDQLWITTDNNGLYLFNIAEKKLFSFKHNAADPTTIVNNAPSNIVSSSSGWIFIGNTPNGISYFKNNAVIGQQLTFTNTNGNGYDGYINSITTLDNDNYYIAISDNLLLWKRSTNSSQFLATEQNDKAPFIKHGVNEVSFDNQKRLWVAVPGIGVFVLDKRNKVIAHFKADSLLNGGIPSNYVRHIQMDAGGEFMWLSTRLGACKISIANLKVENGENPLFNWLSGLACNRVWFADKDNVWIATETKGAWHYTFSTKKIEKYIVDSGKPNTSIFCFNKDKFNNIYIGSQAGLLLLLNNGKTKMITTKDGLLHRRIEALLLDKSNRMWIGNDVGLSCFSIADTSIKVFDERYGLSVQGFRVNAYCQNSDDELVWGTERGLQYFYPDNLWAQKISLTTTVSRVETRDIVQNLTQDATLQLAASDNYVTFYFSSIDYSKHLRTFYEYKLEGLDENWVKVTDQTFVRYSAVPAGKYTFKVRASNDGKIWGAAKNTVGITIAKAAWQQVWFKLLVATFSALIIWYIFRYYKRRHLVRQEQLETEVVVNYFASQINSHQHTDEMLWDVARNCISKLNFEDCVIYLLEEENNVLVQKAAYGPKSPVDFTIHQPIEIPVGKGIVGTVAKTGKPLLVNNTEQDHRYIIDDKKRFSEIAVPLIIDGKIAGVIDSEHKQKYFFTKRHLQILTTVSVLCANQIQRTKAEEEKRRAGIELLENKQKATESRLQSLRLQMNPHFLFNALNSIQQMILANEEIVATKYLSRFSKLLRAILVHSDKETIMLREELEILNLYIELESIRFKGSFSYTVFVDEDIETEEIKIPTLLVQPFVENAIWHGLMHKEGERVLKIAFTEEGEFVRCLVEDNGIGRQKAAASKLPAGNGKKHASKGIEVSKERLKTLRTDDGREGSITICDLVDGNQIACGTRVEIYFPIQN